MKMSRISYGFLLSCLAVLFLERWWLPSVPTFVPWTVAGIASAGLITSVFLKKETLSVASAALLGGSVAVLLAFRMVDVSEPHDIESFTGGKTVEIHGWVVAAPDVRPVQTKLVISADAVTDEHGTHAVRGRLLATEYSSWPPLSYGDKVIVTGKLERPGKIEDFDYGRYLELSDIRAVIYRAQIDPVLVDGKHARDDRASVLLRILHDARFRTEDRIGMLLPEPHASLLAGLLTGSRRGLSEQLSEDFRISGLTHIIAISGYNITIILAILGHFLFWLPLKRRLVPLALGIALFTLFVGAGPPVVRAAIMGILGLVALQAGRVPTIRLSILWTAFLMLLWNPMMLAYDASFQLSFLAVIGITEIGPTLKRWLKAVPDTLALRESLVATLSALIATLPLSILLFRQISLVAPISNVLVAPLIPLSMLAGTVSLLFSVVWTPLGLVAAYIAWALLELILIIAKVSAAMPWAAITV